MMLNSYTMDAEKRGERRGEKKGAYKKAIETAINLLQMGLSLDNIIKATGLHKEDIDRLITQHKNTCGI